MNNLKKLRMERGLTIRELAEKIQTSSPYISQLENGHRNISTIHQSTKDRLCEALSCTFSDLFSEEDIFEYLDGKLVCDEVYLCTERRMPEAIIKIKDVYYYLPQNRNSEKPLHEQLALRSSKSFNHMVHIKLAGEDEFVRKYAYACLGLVLREPFKINLGRAITVAEWEEFNFDAGEYSSEFKTVVGREFGSHSEIVYSVRQIKISSKAMLTLKERGIQVEKVIDNYYNIRTM